MPNGLGTGILRTNCLSMSTKTDELRELFLKLSPVTTFTDRQEAGVGDVPTDEEVDDTLRTLVAEMRERFGVGTPLGDDDLVALVRGFYAGASDATLADRFDVTVETLVDARLSLQLFRPDDADAPFDLRDLLALVEADASDVVCAAELGVSEEVVSRYRRVVAARQTAQRESYYYPLEFESLLDADTEDELSAAREADRELFAEIKD